MWAERLVAKLGDSRFTGLAPVDWDSVERKYETRLPSDYKYVCDRYSGFSLNGLCILSPRLNVKGKNDLVEATREAEELFLETHDEDDDALEFIPEHNFAALGGRAEMFKFYPHRPGLLKWGQDDGGGNYYWYVDGNPEDWIIITEHRDWIWDQHRMPMSEYLVRGLEGRVQCRVLGSSFARGVDLEELPPQ
ncbi:hypothetical protein HNR23_000492 [Nocardiopsis mwathae]|uniref:Knr4/Smi1-like domain-containing protein n=1 Tax=Nocardiopsis mwathae TaxID=1472723 RepID=A0A7X0D3P7_9ACTN|nr:SMI1/KNR4 family protein [Nocardiopsis mwathae]MBB6170432.1 hypothetical protein [Nocardiopsis mwathae]